MSDDLVEITAMLPSLRLYIICSNMEWNHLPVAGGIYDQHPQLLDDWRKIMNARAAKEAAERAKRR